MAKSSSSSTSSKADKADDYVVGDTRVCSLSVSTSADSALHSIVYKHGNGEAQGEIISIDDDGKVCSRVLFTLVLIVLVQVTIEVSQALFSLCPF